MPKKGLEVVRELSEALPDVVHAVSTRGESWKVRGKLMACQAVHRSAEPNSLMARVSLRERERLIEERPSTYYITEHYEKHPSVLVRLSTASRRELERVLNLSWQYIFEKSQ